jgi:hypothetical protein
MQNGADVALAVAAKRIGISPEAVRRRIGQWCVALVTDGCPDAGRTHPNTHPGTSGRDQPELIAELRGRIADGSAALLRETERLTAALER